MKGSKKLKGRPVMNQPKRIKKVDVRFTHEEFDLLLERIKESGRTKSEFIRLKVLNGEMQTVLNMRTLTNWLDTTSIELSRAGNNINQLARYSNILLKNEILSVVVSERFNLELQKYHAHQKQLEQLIRKIIRSLSAVS